VVLPVRVPSLEKDGTFTSTERRIQRLYKAMEPVGQAKADWEIIQLIANRMGGKWKYKHPSEVMDEVARVTPLFAGVNYERLEGTRVCSGQCTRMGRTRRCCLRRSFRSRMQGSVLSDLVYSSFGGDE